MKRKQNSLEMPVSHISSMNIPLSHCEVESVNSNNNHNSNNLINEMKAVNENVSSGATTNNNNDGANKYENVSDNGSEISDEGYRSLGLIQSNNPKRISLHSQASNEDADTNGEILSLNFFESVLLLRQCGM